MARYRQADEYFTNLFEGRIKVLIIIILFSYGILIFKFWKVQIAEGDVYKGFALNNRIRSVIIQPPRGKIFDSEGNILADNRPSFDVEVMIEDVPNDKKEEISQGLSEILNIPQKSILKTINLSRRVPYVPEKIARDIDICQLTEIQETREKFPGINVQAIPVRDYKKGKFASHILGYIGKISPSEYTQLKEKGYYIQDYIGRMGIENVMEGYLKGEHGGMQIQVDSRGYTDKILGSKDPVPGSDIYLTIDSALQEKVESVMQDKSGAIIVMDPRNGNVLALSSTPSFDPNIFVKPTQSAQINKIFSSKKKYLINRAIREQYPPGSTFKVLVAITALEKGTLSTRDYYFCNGKFYLGSLVFKCWYKYGHGNVNIIDAIRYSCNVFFYNVGHRLKVKDIHKWADQFGFGKKTGIDLDKEIEGVNPSNEWKKRNIGESWYPGDTINLSIGQGYMLITPIQLACYLCAIANGGLLYKPRLIDKIVSTSGEIIATNPVKVNNKINMSDKNYKIIRQGMAEVVESRYGTGSKARVKGFTASGKTGTIQMGFKENQINHAWFMGFAPNEAPEIAIVIFIENAVSGGTDAAPIAGEILDFYLYKRGKNIAKKD